MPSATLPVLEPASISPPSPIIVWKVLVTTITTVTMALANHPGAAHNGLGSAIVPVDLLAAATNPAYFAGLVSTDLRDPSSIALLSYEEGFRDEVLGAEARARRVWGLEWEAFHEMGVYNKKTNSIYITSNYKSLDNPINVTIIDLGNNFSVSSTRYANVHEPNGGTNWFPPFPSQENSTSPSPSQTSPHLLFCDEGDFDHPSALVSVDPTTNTSKIILNNYLGRNFSSINDVRQHPLTGDLWFTDTNYGYWQSFRPAPQLPSQVYRYDARTGAVSVVADGFVAANGLEFSPDLRTLYVSDTGAQQVRFGIDRTRPATLYAFDVSADRRRLANRRTFAYADSGWPDGIHTDTDGNVWAGCGDGVHVWNERGDLIGKVWVGVETNNLAFVPGGLLVFSNKQLWLVEGIKAVGREVCRDFGVCE